MNKNSKRRIVALVLIGFILFVLMIFFAIRAYHHYIELENHREYFNQPNASIQDWMTIRSIVRHYNLSEEKIFAELNVSPGTLISELGLDNSTIIDRLTISTICIEKHLDCKDVVNRLNNYGEK
jgi:hypothetical protein